jgi:hypothetical protein
MVHGLDYHPAVSGTRRLVSGVSSVIVRYAENCYILYPIFLSIASKNASRLFFIFYTPKNPSTTEDVRIIFVYKLSNLLECLTHDAIFVFIESVDVETFYRFFG